MFEPDDFGLSGAAALAQVADPTPSRFHVPFWTAWSRAIGAEEPRLTPWLGPDLDPVDPGATHQFVGQRFVRIGCRLIEPARGRAAVRAGLVSLHGYDNPLPLSHEDERWAPLAERGVATLAIRIRGYPGSLADTGSWTAPSWICRGLDVPTAAGGPEGAESTVADLQAWSLPLGVSDVVNACRALAGHLGHGVPIYLRGESFGAGLAVIGAGVAALHPELGVRIERLQIGLPSLGNWRWRLHESRLRRAGGSQKEIADLLTLEAARADELIERLLICDAAVHAQRVSCPTLCKLAIRDEVVPAPAAAAVYNALHTPPGQKWRFITPFGHFDGGIRNARRHALFDRCTLDFLDPSRDPAEAMAAWEPLLAQGERAPG